MKTTITYYSKGRFNCIDDNGELLGYFTYENENSVIHAKVFDGDGTLVSRFDNQSFLVIWKNVQRFFGGG